LIAAAEDKRETMSATTEGLLDMKTDANYYVYAYFDPRDYEMLYVGKGKGRRKNAHSPNKVGTAKERQIHEIERAGQKPLIKVVAANLTEEHAFLVEKALIWRTGESLTNVSGGHYADNFRPPNTLHLSLPGFDTEHGIFFVNVGAYFGPHRQWEDCYKYNFLAAGYGREHSAQLRVSNSPKRSSSWSGSLEWTSRSCWIPTSWSLQW
jgi:uncharacterized protein